MATQPRKCYFRGVQEITAWATVRPCVYLVVWGFIYFRLKCFPRRSLAEHSHQVDKLPGDLRDDLEQVYTDIRLANSLAWLSTEFNRRTPSLDENYSKLRTSISEKLDKIRVRLERLGED